MRNSGKLWLWIGKAYQPKMPQNTPPDPQKGHQTNLTDKNTRSHAHPKPTAHIKLRGAKVGIFQYF
jgi:hypothetical protein